MFLRNKKTRLVFVIYFNLFVEASITLAENDVLEATTGFQMPMINDHYGYEYLEWSKYSECYHPGVDLNGSGEGDADCNTDINAVANGIVRYVNAESWGSLVIEHLYKGKKWYSIYGHCSPVLVQEGETVIKGEHIAEMGNVGGSDLTCHLHFEIRNENHANPCNGPFWDPVLFQDTNAIKIWYENPESFINSHGSYSVGIEITSPSSGDRWAMNTPRDIRWVPTGTDNILIHLYQEGNSEALLSINNNTPNDGQYQWQIPDNLEPGNNYFIAMSDEDFGGTKYGRTECFSIIDGIRITTPNGDEVLEVGKEYSIIWDRFPSVTENLPYVNIHLYKGGTEKNNFLMSISNNELNDGYYLWNVMSSIESGEDYYIGISSVNDEGNSWDFSDGPFSINKNDIEAIEITSPSSGDRWAMNTPRDIRWVPTGTSNILIHLYQEGNSEALLSINNNTSNDGQYQWQVPDNLEPGNNYFIAMSDEDFGGTRYGRTECFSIIDGIRITTPNGDEVLEVGKEYSIIWDRFPSVTENLPYVNIHLYKGGTEKNNFLMSISNNELNDGYYLWNVMSSIESGEDYYIGISSVNDEGNSWDFSDGPFSINKNDVEPVGEEISQIEYFIDNDPGFGNGYNVSVTSAMDVMSTFEVDIDGLLPGFHWLSVRGKDQSGIWSNLLTRPFYMETSPQNSPVTTLEYFIDEQPAFGQGNQVPIASTNDFTKKFSVDNNGINNGFHTLFIRGRDASGKWTITNSRSFLIESVPIRQNICFVEYSIDNLPEFGEGTEIPIINQAANNIQFVADLNDISPGFHTLFVRSKDSSDKWSICLTRPFLIESISSGTNLLCLEYSIDAIPTDLNSHSVPILPSNNSNYCVLIDLTGIYDGFHTLYFRSKDNSGNWTLTNSRIFNLERNYDDKQNMIVAIEYFYTTEDTILPKKKITGFNPAVDVSLNMNLDVSGLIKDQVYDLNISGINAVNQQSQINRHPFKKIQNNIAPSVLKHIPDITISEDFNDFIHASLDTVFYDENESDRDNLQFSLTYPQSILRAEIKNNTIHFQSIPDIFGSGTIIVTATDNSDASVSDTFNVTIKPVNDAPKIIALPDISFQEDLSFTIDLDDYVTDTDDSLKWLEWVVQIAEGSKNQWINNKSSLSKSGITESVFVRTIKKIIMSDKIKMNSSSTSDTIIILIDPLNHIANFSASLNYNISNIPFQFMVSDTSNASDDDTLLVSVLPINDPPVLSAIPDTDFNEDDSLIINKDYFYNIVNDPDNLKTELRFDFKNNENIYIKNGADFYILKAQNNWYGSEKIEVVVRDNQSADTAFWSIRVNPINDRPSIISIPDTIVYEDSLYKYQVVTEEIDLDDSIIYYLKISPPDMKIDANGLIIWSPDNSDVGSTIVEVIAQDDSGATDIQHFKIHVLNINDPPVLSALPDMSFNEDDSLLIRRTYLLNFVQDQDNPIEQLIWTFSNGKNIHVKAYTDSIVLSSVLNWSGKDTIIVTVSDSLLNDSIKWVINVTPVNDPPFFTDLMPDSISFNSNEKETLSYQNIISDIDTPDSSLVLSVEHNRDVSCSIVDSLKLIVFWVESNISCLDTVIFCLSDGYLIEYDSIIVSVNRTTGINYLMSEIPETYSLKQNYPNPFNPVTHIIYGIPKRTRVKIELYDINGRFIINFIDEYKEPGYYSVTWDAAKYPSGVYFYRIKAGDFIETRKCLLIK